MESNQNGHLQEARYNVDGLRKRKLDKNGNSSKEFATGISTSASRPGNSSSAAPTISYISGHMILGAEIDDGTGPEFVFHLPDALGSTRDVVDSLGNVIRSFEHDEYGNLLSSSGSGAATPKTWIGGLSVNDDTADSGLWNMGHRNYAGGVLGRFISRDPIGFSGSSLNLYAYPTNPVNRVDPTGLEDIYVIYANDGFFYDSFGASSAKEDAMCAGGANRVYQLELNDANIKKAFSNGDVIIIDAHGLTTKPGGAGEFAGFSVDNETVKVSAKTVANAIKSNRKKKQLIFANACNSGKESPMLDALGPEQAYIGWSDFASPNALPFDFVVDLLSSGDTVRKLVVARKSRGEVPSGFNPNSFPDWVLRGSGSVRF